MRLGSCRCSGLSSYFCVLYLRISELRNVGHGAGGLEREGNSLGGWVHMLKRYTDRYSRLKNTVLCIVLTVYRKCGSDRFRFLSLALRYFVDTQSKTPQSHPPCNCVCTYCVLNIFIIINNIEHGVEVIAAMKVNDFCSRLRSPDLSYLPTLRLGNRSKSG